MENMERTEKYFECVFTDGTREEFEHLCTSVEEFGSNKDIIAFKAKDKKYDKDYSVLLQLVPKSQIKQIINHYADSDMKKVFENS